MFRVEDWEQMFEYKLDYGCYVATWSPDGKFLATRGHVFKVEDWKPIFKYKPGKVVAWSLDGKFLAIGGYGFVRVFKVRDWQQVFEWKHSKEVKVLAWSPDGKFLATWGSEGYVRVFRVENWIMVFKHKCQNWIYVFQGAEYSREGRSASTTLTWSPDGKYLVTGRYVFSANILTTIYRYYREYI